MFEWQKLIAPLKRKGSADDVEVDSKSVEIAENEVEQSVNSAISLKICQDFKKKGKCRKGENCPFSHTVENATKLPMWSPKHGVYLKGLPFQASRQEISNFLAACGQIKSVKQCIDESSGRWTGSVVVMFHKKEAVEEALTLDKTVWTGVSGDGVRYVRVARYDPSAKKKSFKVDRNTIFIGNLPETVNETDIHRLFEPFINGCGQVIDIRFAMTDEEDDDKKKCRGFGHIEFASAEGKDFALTLNKSLGEIDGKTPYIRKPTDPEEAKKKTLKQARQKEKREKKSLKRPGSSEGQSPRKKRKSS